MGTGRMGSGYKTPLLVDVKQNVKPTGAECARFSEPVFGEHEFH